MTQPLLSPDGYWWWDGAAWRPVGVHSGAAPAAPAAPWAPLAPSVHDGQAIAALVLGILGLPLPVLAPAALGFWLGSRNKARAAARGTSGLAVAGLVLGLIGCVQLAFLLLGLGLILFGAAGIS